MRITYVSNARMPTERAHGIQIMHMCAALAAEGAAVTLLMPRRHNKIHDDVFVYYDLPETFRVVYVPCIDLLWLRWAESFFYFVELFTFLFFARWYLLRHDADAIFSRELFLSLFTRRVVYEAHTVPPQPSRIERWLLQRTQLIIAISHGLASDLMAHGVPTKKITVLPDGVSIKQFARPPDFDRAAVRERLFGAHKNRTVIVYAGSYFLHPWKGVNTLLDAAEKLDENFIFYLVGGCPEEIEEGGQILRARSIKNVVLVPRIIHTAVAEYVQAADMVALPNSGAFQISARHTSPLKLFEYMAAGTPIIAPDLPSTREILSEQTAVMVIPDNATAWADAFRQGALHAQGLSPRATSARTAVDAYDWRVRAGTLLKLIA